MPRAGYIICSTSGALDTYTNAVSAHGIVEVIQLRKLPEGSGPEAVKPFPMRVVAAWLREEGETAEDRFEAQLVAHFPTTGGEAVLAQFPQFGFRSAVHRVIAPEINFPGFPGPGFLQIECRLRRAGEAEWTHRQSQVIVLVEAPPAPPGDAEQKQPG